MYANWAALQNKYYTFGPYISPFYSPEIFGDSPHAWFGPKPSWYPSFLPFSPALFILWIPGLFRFTCYYYRGAYYKSFWADPPACAVGEPRKSYLRRAQLSADPAEFSPLFSAALLHRLGIPGLRRYEAFWFPDGFGIGVGTHRARRQRRSCSAAMSSAATRSATWSAAAFDRISEHPVRHKLYDCVTCLNGNHKKWAWASLFSVGFADIYVRLCAMGIWSDWRIL